MEASGRSDDTEARTVSQLAAKLPAHQPSPGHGQDCRSDNTRLGHSAIHQVLRLVEQIKKGFNRQECTGAALDVAKAFDKGKTQSLLPPQEDLQNQAGRTAVHREDSHSRSAARISDFTPAVQHLHQRYPDNCAHQPGDVLGRCLHLFKVPQCESDRPTSPDSTRHFAGLIRKME
ncbi:hypothetical protein Trydic_g7526 [Trypoxylus dichotomus]